MIRNNTSKIEILKFFDKKNIGSLPRILISSVLVVFFLYSAPLLINFANKDLNSVQNNAKAVLAYTLNKKKNGTENSDEILNENDLLRDIFTLNDFPLLVKISIKPEDFSVVPPANDNRSEGEEIL